MLLAAALPASAPSTFDDVKTSIQRTYDDGCILGIHGILHPTEAMTEEVVHEVDATESREETLRRCANQVTKCRAWLRDISVRDNGEDGEKATGEDTERILPSSSDRKSDIVEVRACLEYSANAIVRAASVTSQANKALRAYVAKEKSRPEMILAALLSCSIEGEEEDDEEALKTRGERRQRRRSNSMRKSRADIAAEELFGDINRSCPRGRANSANRDGSEGEEKGAISSNDALGFGGEIDSADDATTSTHVLEDSPDYCRSQAAKNTYEDMKRRMESAEAGGLRDEINLFASVYIAAELEDRLLYGVRLKNDDGYTKGSAAGSILGSATNLLNSRVGVFSFLSASSTTPSPRRHAARPRSTYYGIDRWRRGATFSRSMRRGGLGSSAVLAGRNNFGTRHRDGRTFNKTFTGNEGDGRFSHACDEMTTNGSRRQEDASGAVRIDPNFRHIGAVVRLVLNDARERGMSWKAGAHGTTSKDKAAKAGTTRSLFAIDDLRYRDGDALVLCEGIHIFIDYLVRIVPHGKAWVGMSESATHFLRQDLERYLCALLEPTLLCRSARLSWQFETHLFRKARLDALRRLRPEDLGIDPFACPNSTVIGLAAQELVHLVLCSSPIDKLRSIARSYQILSDAFSLPTRIRDESNARSSSSSSSPPRRRRFGADDVFPVFIYVVAKAASTLRDRALVAHGGSCDDLVKCDQIINSELEQRASLCAKYRHSLATQIEYIETTASREELDSEEGYCLAHLRSALTYLERDEAYVRGLQSKRAEEMGGGD